MKSSFVFFLTALFFLFLPLADATEEMAEKTGKTCAACHFDPSGGGELTRAGKDYLLTLSENAEEKEAIPAGWKKALRLIAGYLHLLTAIFWFGTILYVHIVLKPSYAASGLPRGEVRVGLISLVVMAVTGTILSFFRVPSLAFLISTRFGILLLIKVSLFLIMACSALYVVFFIGPRLRKKRETQIQSTGDLTADELRSFDGADGRPAYAAYKGTIYDMTPSRLWQKGVHFGRHNAGIDLTEMLDVAPHGEEKILAMPRVGRLIPAGEKKARPRHEKLFYFMAYMNLVLVLLITLIVALWRWL